MRKENTTLIKLTETALMAALCYVTFTFLQIKIPLPGGDASSIHLGNAVCVLAALMLGGVYGGLAGAIGMSIADIMDPVYITVAPKTFVLKLCIGLITGLVAHLSLIHILLRMYFTHLKRKVDIRPLRIYLKNNIKL